MWTRCVPSYAIDTHSDGLLSGRVTVDEDGRCDVAKLKAVAAQARWIGSALRKENTKAASTLPTSFSAVWCSKPK
eukprot:4754569-Amphidinium_carterae.1